jgi:hypothetical protein
MVKTKFKMDTKWVRLIILNIVYYTIWCDRWYGGTGFGCWFDMCWLGDDMDSLHVKRMTCSAFHLYNYIGYHYFYVVNKNSFDANYSTMMDTIQWWKVNESVKVSDYAHYYYNTPIVTVGARGTHAAATSAHSSDGPSNISKPLLLAPTIVTDYLTSKDCCYCRGARDTNVVATSLHNSNGTSDISGPLLLAPTVATDSLTSEDHCYYGGTWYGRGCY